MATNEAFDDCVVLEKDAFDPDAVFHEDIVDDDVLPYLSLAVDGLTVGNDDPLLRPEDVEPPPQPDTVMPDTTLGPDQLEVYGWESSLWRKLRGYLGL